MAHFRVLNNLFTVHKKITDVHKWPLSTTTYIFFRLQGCYYYWCVKLCLSCIHHGFREKCTLNALCALYMWELTIKWLWLDISSLLMQLVGTSYNFIIHISTWSMVNSSKVFHIFNLSTSNQLQQMQTPMRACRAFIVMHFI